MASYVALIPARMASSRLPGKPLLDIGGLPMVVRVARQVAKSGAEATVVATDDDRIATVCAAHGVDCVMTSSHHPSGSDRLAEACGLLDLHGDRLVVNVQGDEPLIEPALIDAVADALVRHPACDVSTAAHPIDNMADFLNPNVVKVVTDQTGVASYFSRAPIPWSREGMSDLSKPAATNPNALPRPAPLRHIGLYAYKAGFLRQFPTLAEAPTERLEALEQLRALWHGHRIAVHVTDTVPSPGVDTQADLERVRQIVANTHNC
ncbi:3-deoxy-manno-octulosonate cytidylyltransferase [Hydrogenophaga sp. 5NK40-0174]|uniref:3-deoxy-manno-octulosonate cytidylyltransferase n=1 Tax=Hydrogenophaga sp. 5NK40-0174 TaxID=3127649 RepID=UPI00310A2847